MARNAVSGRFLQRDCGTCLSFAGGSGATGNIVSLPSGVYNNITTSFTLTAWVKRRGSFTVASNQNIFRSTGADHLWFNYQADSRIRIYLSEGSTNSTTTTNPVAQDYNYHFVAATWDGATVKIYHDNVLVGSQAVTGTINWGGGGLNVGGGSNTAPILGFIDEPTVFSRALNTTELTDLYYSNKVPSSGLVARYLLDEGSGTSATDSSGNGNTGTVSGATYSSNVAFKPRSVTSGRVLSTNRILA